MTLTKSEKGIQNLTVLHNVYETYCKKCWTGIYFAKEPLGGALFGAFGGAKLGLVEEARA